MKRILLNDFILFKEPIRKTTLTFEQRLKVYREAYRTFQVMAAQKAHKEHVTGMCEHITRAFKKLGYTWQRGYDLDACSRRCFPEYHSFKPRTMWRDDGYYTSYWWSTKTPRGRERRFEVMKALSEGKIGKN